MQGRRHRQETASRSRAHGTARYRPGLIRPIVERRIWQRQAADVRVLIVEHNRDLANIWARFLARQGVTCTLAGTAPEAFAALRGGAFEALVLDMELPKGEAIAVADFATYRNPDLPIIAVTARGFFSDGAIFELVPNARGLLRAPLRLEDMAALVEHYGGRVAAAQREAAG
jgi:DNA-binding NtrC family response regulator